MYTALRRPRPTLAPLFVLPVVSAAGAGCQRVTCEEADAAEPSCEIGSGADGFTPLAEGDTLAIDYGSQGGNHVWVALHTTGIATGTTISPYAEGNPDIRLWFTDVEGGLLAEMTTRADYAALGEGALEFSGLQFVVEPYDWASTLGSDARVSLHATVEDRCGHVVEDEVEVRLDLSDFAPLD